MAYEKTIKQVSLALDQSEQLVDRWFDEAAEVRRFRPADGGWTIDNILEHISLTSFFLLKIIRRHVQKAIRRAGQGAVIHDGESDLDRLEPVAQRSHSSWPHPEHMTPAGNNDITGVRSAMREQFAECRMLLRQMEDGSGSLATVHLSVADLGKLDMYEWICFLALHARRHAAQMEAVKAEAQHK